MLKQKLKKILAAAVLLVIGVGAAHAQKIKPEEVLVKHLDSIGNATTRSALVNITIVGDVAVAFGPSGTYPTPGKSVFASEGDKLLYAMTFPVPSYPLEKLTFDGKDLKVGFAERGTRSGLGNFVLANGGLFKETLLGGVLSTNWSLIDLSKRGAKLSVDGTKKIDGKDVYSVTYAQKHGDGLLIKMFFDKETFRHVRTEYSRVVAPQMGVTPEASAHQSENYETLTEEFYDFKTDKGLTLPHGYKLMLYLQRNGRLAEYRYTFALKDFYYNRTLDPETFSGN